MNVIFIGWSILSNDIVCYLVTIYRKAALWQPYLF